MLVVVVLDGLWSWRLPCRKTPAADRRRFGSETQFLQTHQHILGESEGTIQQDPNASK